MTNLPPAPRHARLGKCKREEHADCIERNQQGYTGFEDNDQNGCDEGKRDDSVRIDKTASAEGQLTR